MKFTYDKRADAIAIVFKEGARISKDVEIAPEVFAGYDRQGNLIEIQILEVSEQEKSWLSLEAVSKILGKSTRTILRWIESGKVNPPKVGRDYHFSPAMVQSLSGEPQESPAKKRAGKRR